MFCAAKVPKAPWITMGPPWPDSTQAYARSHGKSWENDYRRWLVTAVSQWGGNAIVYFADALKGAIELEMYLVDTASPVDGHHIVDSDNSASWLKNVGVNIHIPILTDSPGTINMAAVQSLIQDLAKAYKTSRGLTVVWLVGLECNRNMTVAQVCQVAAWVRQYVGSDAPVVCGSANQEFLKSVHAADAKMELWKEQDGHPINQALTSATAPAYLTELDQFAALVGPGKVWAGEWFSMDDATRKAITAQIVAKGYNCGCGQF